MCANILCMNVRQYLVCECVPYIVHEYVLIDLVNICVYWMNGTGLRTNISVFSRNSRFGNKKMKGLSKF